MNAIIAIAVVVLKELYRRKDFYVLFVLTVLMTLLLGSMNFFNERGIVRYLKEVCLLLIWVASLVIAIATAARQIPAEKESRTIFPLLAKPVSRYQVMIGKFLGCWWAVGISLLVFYVFFTLLSGMREHSWPLVQYLQAASLHWLMLGIVIAATLLGSLVFAAPSSNGTICFIFVAGMLTLGRHLNKVALSLGEPGESLVYALYYLLPHLELFDVRDLIIHGWNAVPWLIWGGATLYAVVYMAIFLTAACWLFKRKQMA